MIANQQSRRTVLVADDEPQFRQLVTRVCEMRGIRVLMAADGRQAMDVLDEEGNVDVIVLDLEMPVMDGRAVCSELRANTRLSAVPVLLVSGNPSLEAEAARLAVRAFLHKPFHLSDFVELVETLAAPSR